MGRSITALTEEEFVVAVGTSEAGLGRKAVLMDINGAGRYAIGVDVDIYHISAGISNLNGDILLRQSVPAPNDFFPDAMADAVFGLIETLCDRYPRPIYIDNNVKATAAS